MTARLRLTRKAEADLEEIADFIGRDSPARALSFVADLRQRCRRICDFPEHAMLRPDIASDVPVVVDACYLIL